MALSAGLMGAGALAQGIGSIFASNAQQKAAGEANQTLGGALSSIKSSQTPYTNAGSQAISSLQNDLSNGSGFAAPFAMKDFYNSPGYQFTLQQGQNAINNSAAAKGGLLSGAAGKGLAQYSAGLANQTYNSAYSNYLQNRQQGYNELAGVAGMGQQATQNVNSATQNIAGQQAQNTIGAGNAAAAGIMGMAGAAGSGANTLGQAYQAKQGGLFGGMNSGIFGGM